MNRCRAGARDLRCKVAGIALAWFASLGATWHVSPDPVNPVNRIGPIVEQTSPGDTILAAPGTYFEHIHLPSYPLVFIGSGGAELTILDGSIPIEGREGSILYTREWEACGLTVRGFTFRHGAGMLGESQTVKGGAIAFQSDVDCTSGVVISDCIFEENSTIRPALEGWGGALHLRWASSQIANCTFRSNLAYYGGHIDITGGSTTLSDCTLLVPNVGPQLSGAFLWVDGGGVLKIERCSMVSQAAAVSGQVSGLYLMASEMELNDNLFQDEGAAVLRQSVLASAPTCCPFTVVKMNGNVLCGPELPASEYVLISLANGRIALNGNTLVNTRMSISNISGEANEVMNNLLYDSKVSVLSGPGGRVSCNDVWPSGDDLHLGCCGLVTENNMNADPKFCGLASGDYRLSSESECAEENAPAGCGQIGARGVGCEQTPVERTSWGRLKALYR